MPGKDLTDLLIEQGFIEPVSLPYILDGSTFDYTTDEESQKQEKDRA